MEVRDADEAALPGILGIYNDALLATTAVWNETTVDLDNRRPWLPDRRKQGCSILVAVEGGTVLGYASFGD